MQLYRFFISRLIHITTDCQPTVASVISKHLPQYLHNANSRYTYFCCYILLSSWQSPLKPSHCSHESVVHSLLLSTQVNSEVDYRNRILHNPVTLYFRPTPFVRPIYMYTTVSCICVLSARNTNSYSLFLQNFNYTNETCVFWDPVRK